MSHAIRFFQSLAITFGLEIIALTGWALTRMPLMCNAIDSEHPCGLIEYVLNDLAQLNAFTLFLPTIMLTIFVGTYLRSQANRKP